MCLAPQNIPRAISVLTLGSKVILYCKFGAQQSVSVTAVTLRSKVILYCKFGAQQSVSVTSVTEKDGGRGKNIR